MKQALLIPLLADNRAQAAAVDTFVFPASASIEKSGPKSSSTGKTGPAAVSAAKTGPASAAVTRTTG